MQPKLETSWLTLLETVLIVLFLVSHIIHIPISIYLVCVAFQ